MNEDAAAIRGVFFSARQCAVDERIADP